MSESARYWHLNDAGQIVCELCPRYCKLNEGQRGLCFVRKRVQDRMELTTYGRSSGFCVDPVEKKPLNHFLPGSDILSFGTAGCNLTCTFCQNWDMSKSRQMDRLQSKASPEDIAVMAEKQKCLSVAYTYNDPIIFMEYAVDIAKCCSERNIKSVAVTNGYITSKAREEFFSSMDGANIDLKGFSDSFYQRLCSAELQPVLDTLKYVANETACWLEITNLLIPDENDSEQELSKMIDWLLENLGPDVPIHFTAFHPAYRLRNKSRTPDETLHFARNLGISKGLNFVYTGNIYNPDGAATYCVNCGDTLIVRHIYQIKQTGIERNGTCRNCGTVCPGVFD